MKSVPWRAVLLRALAAWVIVSETINNDIPEWLMHGDKHPLGDSHP